MYLIIKIITKLVLKNISPLDLISKFTILNYLK